MQTIPWRGLMMIFVERFVVIIEKGSYNLSSNCLILDDFLLSNIGNVIEFTGRLWNHVNDSYELGLRLLLLCYYDGKSNLPLNFLLHPEKGKNEQGLLV